MAVAVHHDEEMACGSLHTGYVDARPPRAGGRERGVPGGAPGSVPLGGRPGGRLAPVHDQNGRAASGWSRLRPAITSLGRTGVASKERGRSPLDASRRAVTIRRARSSRPPAARPCTSIYTERSFVGKTPCRPDIWVDVNVRRAPGGAGSRLASRPSAAPTGSGQGARVRVGRGSALRHSTERRARPESGVYARPYHRRAAQSV